MAAEPAGAETSVQRYCVSTAWAQATPASVSVELAIRLTLDFTAGREAGVVTEVITGAAEPQPLTVIGKVVEAESPVESVPVNWT